MTERGKKCKRELISHICETVSNDNVPNFKLDLTIFFFLHVKASLRLTVNTQRWRGGHRNDTYLVCAALTWFQYNHARYICNNEWIYEMIMAAIVIHKHTFLTLEFRQSPLCLFGTNKCVSHTKYMYTQN